MERRPVIVTAAVLALIAALVVTAVRWGEQPDPEAAGTAADAHRVVVRTVLVGPATYYFEGALVEVELRPEVDRSSETTRSTAPVPVGRTVTWSDVPAGAFGLAGAVHPCSGSCDVLGPPTDSCRLDLELAADAEVVVTFRWGRPCVVSVLDADETVVPRIEDDTTVAAARVALEGLGLAVELTSVWCSTHATDSALVLRAVPRPGSVVTKGSAVVLERCHFP